MRKMPLTYDDLMTFIASLTPEQRAMEVTWVGENRGGQVYRTFVLPEDQVNLGEGWVPITQYQQQLKVHSGLGESEIKARMQKIPIAAKKDQPLLGVEQPYDV